MSLVKYTAFIKVVELGSVTAAAKEMGYSQPGISHMLNSLELELGFPLMIRSKDSIKLTKEGEAIIECCKQVIHCENNLQETASLINNLAFGKIRIGALHSTLINFVPLIIGEFTNFYSEIDISLQEKLFPETHSDLINGNIDLAFTCCPVQNMEYDFIPLFEDTIGIILPINHPLTSYNKIPLTALDGCDFIAGSENYDDIFDVIMSTNLFKPGAIYSVDSDTASIAMVAAKMGAYAISKLQKNSLPENVVFKEFQENCSRKIGIAVKPIKKSQPVISKFIDVAKSVTEKFLSTY